MLEIEQETYDAMANTAKEVGIRFGTMALYDPTHPEGVPWWQGLLRRMLIDTAQLWEAWTANERRLASYSGSLGWQTLRSGQYLV